MGYFRSVTEKKKKKGNTLLNMQPAWQRMGSGEKEQRWLSTRLLGGGKKKKRRGRWGSAPNGPPGRNGKKQKLRVLKRKGLRPRGACPERGGKKKGGDVVASSVNLLKKEQPTKKGTERPSRTNSAFHPGRGKKKKRPSQPGRGNKERKGEGREGGNLLLSTNASGRGKKKERKKRKTLFGGRLHVRSDRSATRWYEDTFKERGGEAGQEYEKKNDARNVASCLSRAWWFRDA